MAYSGVEDSRTYRFTEPNTGGSEEETGTRNHLQDNRLILLTGLLICEFTL